MSTDKGRGPTLPTLDLLPVTEPWRLRLPRALQHFRRTSTSDPPIFLPDELPGSAEFDGLLSGVEFVGSDCVALLYSRDVGYQVVLAIDGVVREAVKVAVHAAALQRLLKSLGAIDPIALSLIDERSLSYRAQTADLALANRIVDAVVRSRRRQHRQPRSRRPSQEAVRRKAVPESGEAWLRRQLEALRDGSGP